MDQRERKRRTRFRLALQPRGAMAASVIALLAGSAAAQTQTDTCPLKESFVTSPAHPLLYPMTSDRYAVQYSVGGAPWTLARVYVSYYGGTLASPYRSDSPYALPYQTPSPTPVMPQPQWETSMSFVSIPARANALVQLRVIKLWGTPFQPSDHLSVRPSVKLMDADLQSDGSVRIATVTSSVFAGEQFALWWNRGTQGGAVESLVFFLNPPYQPPTGSNVLVVKSEADLAAANQPPYDTLDFEGPKTIELPGMGTPGTGTQAFAVPDNIHTIYFGTDAWVQGKLKFNPIASSPPTVRKLYGPGVLDVSRFDYLQRVCPSDEGLYALTSTNTATSNLDHFMVDGPVLIDINHAANDPFYNSTLNNVKVLGWNGENAALRLGDSTTASNLFVRSGDDSLMMWGSPVTISNATIWQNYNGGVVSLGWSDNSFGNGGLIDGLYVIKTDWTTPTDPATAWTARIPAPGVNTLQSQNNAVFTSLMVPKTAYGTMSAPWFRNIFIDDPPQVLFSFKIVPPICATTGSSCVGVDLHLDSHFYLNIENLFTPASLVENSIGFETVPAGYPNPKGTAFSSDTMLTGSMSISLMNVFLRLSNGFWIPLTKEDAGTQGKIDSRGNVNLTYGFQIP